MQIQNLQGLMTFQSPLLTKLSLRLKELNELKLHYQEQCERNKNFTLNWALTAVGDTV
jgi:hypothetical protein